MALPLRTKEVGESKKPSFHDANEEGHVPKSLIASGPFEPTRSGAENRMQQVSKLMSRKLITVSPEDSVERAVQLLRQRGVRHLLVLRNGRLVGIVSDRDLKRALDPARSKKKKLLNL